MALDSVAWPTSQGAGRNHDQQDSNHDSSAAMSIAIPSPNASASIKRELEVTDSDYDRGKANERIAKIGRRLLAASRVGAPTETRTAPPKLRIEDPQRQPRTAGSKKAIVPGGGNTAAATGCRLDRSDRRLNGDSAPVPSIVQRALPRSPAPESP